jgi:nucleotide-sensitive chloride channel 1A
MEILHTPPTSSSFIPLAEHQSHTPESFYSGPPVLHHFSQGCKIVILDRDLRSSPALSGLRGGSAGAAGSDVGAANANGEEGSGEDKEVIIEGVDVWITSEYVYSEPRPFYS